jgi:hypothetical protein
VPLRSNKECGIVEESGRKGERKETEQEVKTEKKQGWIMGGLWPL